MGQVASTSSTVAATLSTTSTGNCPHYSLNPTYDFAKCPSVTLTPVSTTVTITATSITGTVTGYEYDPAAIVTKTVTSIANAVSYQYIYVGTTTITDSPTYVIKQVPFTTTVTVPTPSGFTPVACMSTYRQPFPSTSTFTVTTTTTMNTFHVITSTSSNTLTVTTTVYPVTITTVQPYFYPNFVDFTPTSTITRTNPTKYVYEACNTLNVVEYHPYGFGYIGYAYPYEPGIETAVPASGPADCCAQCQQTANCFGNSYFVGNDTGAKNQCFLFLLDPNGSETCNPSQTVGNIDASTYPGPTPFVYVSNGACGQNGFHDYGNANPVCNKLN